MHIGYTEEQEKLRQELRTYYRELLTPEVEAELGHEHGVGPTTRRIFKQMAADGWVGIGWPKEYGGQGRSQLEQFVFFDESMRCGAPVPMLTINTVGPTIMQFGTDEQKNDYLPRILKGEIMFCVGYSEPGAGTDLASLQTRAVRDGDEYVINGQKIFTQPVDATPTTCGSRRAPIPTSRSTRASRSSSCRRETPGFSFQPMHLLSEHDINQTYYDDVRVPVSNCVGGENNGWSLITNQLNHERVTLCSTGIPESMFSEVRQYAQQTKLANGQRVIDQEWVQMNLARVYARLEFLKLINWKVAWSASTGAGLNVADASTIKVFGTEFYLEAFRLLFEILGEASYLVKDSPEAVLKARLERYYRSLLILTFGGGVNEVQRDLIAMFGLGMPRSLR